MYKETDRNIVAIKLRTKRRKDTRWPHCCSSLQMFHLYYYPTAEKQVDASEAEHCEIYG